MAEIVPEGPRSAVPFQNEWNWRRSAREFLHRAARNHGGICRFRLKGRDHYFVSDPEWVREVLVVKDKAFIKGPGFQKLKPWLGNGVVISEGEEHKRQRRLLQPSFHHQRIEAYAETMGREAEKAAGSLKEGDRVLLLPVLESNSFQIATACIFDENLDRSREPFFKSIRQTLRYLDTMNSYAPAAFWKRMSGTAEREKEESVRTMHELVDGLILSRRRDASNRGDLLSILVSTLDAEGDGKGLSDEEVRDQVITLLIASFDTVSVSLTSCFYQLATHPEAEGAVLEELDHVLAGRAPGFSDVMRLEKTTAAYTEALRLYPPAWILPRTAVEAVEIGGYTIPERASVLVSPYVNHRDARYFPDPERYDIGRWDPARKQALPKFAFFPFGGGSRVCAGEQFAWMEAVIVLATFLQRWRFEPLFEGPMPYRTTTSLRPANGCPVLVRKRK